MKSVFEFIDYRKYLEEYYQEKKSTTRNFSYRYFSKKARNSSPAFLKYVIEGKRNLTAPVIEKFCEALEFNKKETVYFRNLVLFNQAKTAWEKQEYYAVLRSLANTVREAVLKNNQYDYFEKWYTSILRELICLFNFGEDYDLMAKTMYPAISAAEAKKAVKLLLDLKLVEPDPEGGYRQTNAAIAANDSITSMAVRNYLDQMLDHSKNAMYNLDKKSRYVSSITVGASQSAYDMIVAETNAFKDRIKAIVNSDKGSSKVYQYNIQFFPTSKNINNLKEGGGK